MDNIALLDRDAASSTTSTIDWAELRAEVQHYLERQGMPPSRAEQCSHEIVVLCASEVDGPGRARLAERAMNEAQTMLVGWQAARRSALLAAA